MSNDKEETEMGIKELDSVAARDAGIDMEEATELVQLEAKFRQINQMNNLMDQAQQQLQAINQQEQME